MNLDQDVVTSPLDGDGIFLPKKDREDIPAEVRIIPTGIATLDLELKGGLRSGTLTVVCAHTGYGKSSFVVHASQFAAHMGHPVLILFFPDLTKTEYYQRLTAWECNEGHYSDIPPYPEEHFPLIELIQIDPTDTSFMNRMGEVVREFSARHAETPLIVFDCLDSDGCGRDSLESRARALASLANETGAVVMATSQGNEKSRETRTVTDDCVRDTKAKVFPASLFIGLGHTLADKYAGVVTLTIDKNRNGQSFQVRAGVDWSHQRFFDLDDTFELHSPYSAASSRQIENPNVNSA